MKDVPENNTPFFLQPRAARPSFPLGYIGKTEHNTRAGQERWTYLFSSLPLKTWVITCKKTSIKIEAAKGRPGKSQTLKLVKKITPAPGATGAVLCSASYKDRPLFVCCPGHYDVGAHKNAYTNRMTGKMKPDKEEGGLAFSPLYKLAAYLEEGLWAGDYDRLILISPASTLETARHILSPEVQGRIARTLKIPERAI